MSLIEYLLYRENLDAGFPEVGKEFNFVENLLNKVLHELLVNEVLGVGFIPLEDMLHGTPAGIFLYV